MLKSTGKCLLVAALLLCFAAGCARGRRREFVQRAADLKIQVQQLQQQVDTQEARIERLETQIAELSKNR